MIYNEIMWNDQNFLWNTVKIEWDNLLSGYLWVGLRKNVTILRNRFVKNILRK